MPLSNEQKHDVLEALKESDFFSDYDSIIAFSTDLNKKPTFSSVTASQISGFISSLLKHFRFGSAPALFKESDLYSELMKKYHNKTHSERSHNRTDAKSDDSQRPPTTSTTASSTDQSDPVIPQPAAINFVEAFSRMEELIKAQQASIDRMSVKQDSFAKQMEKVLEQLKKPTADHNVKIEINDDSSEAPSPPVATAVKIETYDSPSEEPSPPVAAAVKIETHDYPSEVPSPPVAAAEAEEVPNVEENQETPQNPDVPAASAPEAVVAQAQDIPQKRTRRRTASSWNQPVKVKIDEVECGMGPYVRLQRVTRLGPKIIRVAKKEEPTEDDDKYGNPPASQSDPPSA